MSIVTEEAFDELDAPPERITGAEVTRAYPLMGFRVQRMAVLHRGLPTTSVAVQTCADDQPIKEHQATCMHAGANALCSQPRGARAADH